MEDGLKTVENAIRSRADNIREQWTIKPSRPLGRNQIVVYRCKGVHMDKTVNRLMIPTQYVPNTDRAWDHNTDDWKDIAFIRRIRPDGSFEMGKIWFRRENGGMIRLDGRKMEDQSLYAYLEASNFNESNKHRDKSIRPLFERIDKDADTLDQKSKRDQRYEALQVAKAMSEREVREYIAAMGGDQKKKMELLRAEVEQRAEKNPSAFLGAQSSEQISLKAEIKEAFDYNVIKHNRDLNCVVWESTNDIIMQIPMSMKPTDALASFILTNGQGDAIHKEIVRQTQVAQVSESQDQNEKKIANTLQNQVAQQQPQGEGGQPTYQELIDAQEELQKAAPEPEPQPQAEVEVSELEEKEKVEAVEAPTKPAPKGRRGRPKKN